MRFRSLTLLVLLAMVMANPSWAVYGVRISDLGYRPVPPNPIRVCGKVTSESPLKISDGRAEITVTGRSAALGEFLVLDGWWNGQFFSVASLGEMIYIPAGSFLMGNSSTADDATYGREDEFPQHPVYLSDYWIGKYEVTRGEYAQFMAAGGYSDPAYWSTAGWTWRMDKSRTKPDYWEAVQNWGSPPGSFTQTDDHPVVGVTYYEAEAFCNWAGGHLPTEAQWEKAARWTGDYPNVYPWDGVWHDQKCNHKFDSLYPGYQTSPVGSYPSGVSPYGCHDMAGNVRELCKDWYARNYYSETPPGGWVDPEGPTGGTYAASRGGHWFLHYYYYCRCATRFVDRPDSESNYLGFRLAR